MELSELDYKITNDLIAISPKKPRDSSLLLLDNIPPKIIKFKNIVNLLKPNDVLVVNDTRVINAHIIGAFDKREISLNLNKLISKSINKWSVFLKTKKKLKISDKIYFKKGLSCQIIKITFHENFPTYEIKFNISYGELINYLKLYGNIPLPPYIKNKRTVKHSDKKNYQTIFAKKIGAVAAPTASLHFTEKLIEKLKKKKVNIVYLTLHVNGGTFLPIKSNNISDHKIHSEEGVITKKNADKINFLRNNGGRIFAVGTTVLRLLESSKDKKGMILPFEGKTSIFIKPGWKINTVDALITNFHTPKSTLLLLVIAMIGKKRTSELYNHAIKNKMRFYSYGDACLLWNKNE